MLKKRFKVTVNGRGFDVEVEELDGGSSGSASGTPATAAKGAPPVSRAPGAPAAPKAATVAAPLPAKAPSSTNDNQPGWITCPMTGKILKIPVKVGDVVKAGDVVAVLEAMKMESAICAPAAGRIEEIAVAEGVVVDSDTRLIRCV